MKFYYNIPDCEHEGDVFSAEQDLFRLGCTKIIDEDYSYEDDEDPDNDHEICGCTIIFEAPESCKQSLLNYGCNE